MLGRYDTPFNIPPFYPRNNGMINRGNYFSMRFARILETRTISILQFQF